MKTSLAFTFLALALAASIQCEAHAQEKQLRVTQDKQYIEYHPDLRRELQQSCDGWAHWSRCLRTL